MSVHIDHDWFPKPVPENVVLGERSYLHGSYAFLHFQSTLTKAVTIGHDSGIYIGTYFDLGPQASVHIGNFCCLVGVIISSHGHVAIGDYSFISHEVVIADHDIQTPPAIGKPSPGRIIIGENVWIGANAVILAGARIGEGSIIGAGAVVDFEVPPYSLVAGNPASVKRKIGR